MKGRILFLKQDANHLYFSDKYPNRPSVAGRIPSIDLVKDYFSLHVSVVDLYNQWAIKDSHFSRTVGSESIKIEATVKSEEKSAIITDITTVEIDTNLHLAAANFNGIRILRQDPWENLISFICSSNNNIKRISQMVDNLCTHFGDELGTHDGVVYYDFPTPAQLAGSETEKKLRDLGFGYRAKYIQQTAQKVSSAIDLLDLANIDVSASSKSGKKKKRKESEQVEEPYESQADGEQSKKGLEYLDALRSIPYEKAHLALLQFSGVGPKVADCVCLMSLDKHDVVPVDTHVWQIAQRDYKFKSTSKAKAKAKKASGEKEPTPTKTEYEQVAKFFKDLWGEYAGWAHSVLFTADLKDLNNGVNNNGSAPVSITQQAVIKSTKSSRKRKTVEKFDDESENDGNGKSEDDEPPLKQKKGSHKLSNREERLRNRRELLYGV